MILGGDECGRSQSGNNNAWCQDNELSWFDWSTGDTELEAFTEQLIRLRREHPVFRRAAFLTGREVRDSGLPDVWWFRPDGRRMTHKDWQREDARTLGVFLNGQEIPSRTPHGEEIVDDSFLLLFNAHFEPVTFTLPTRRFGSGAILETVRSFGSICRANTTLQLSSVNTAPTSRAVCGRLTRRRARK